MRAGTLTRIVRVPGKVMLSKACAYEVAMNWTMGEAGARMQGLTRQGEEVVTTRKKPHT
jgi:hypothetical protein